MGNGSGRALSVIALIISLGFGGYFIVDKFILAPPTTTTSIPSTNQYYEQGPGVYIPASEAWTPDSYLNIEFNLTEGETVYFSFEGLVLFDDSSITNTYIEFRFKVDGIIWNSPYRRVWRYNLVSGFGIRFSVVMQHYNSTMSAGPHDVSIIAKGDHNIDLISAWSLFILTFK
ncbi:MAG: hypothetical protein ACFE9Q_10010 [Candidatus Hodarchaeota archaeon]